MEALARGVRPDGALVPPVHLFKLAAAEGLSRPVEDLCRASAIQNFTRLDGRAGEVLLFLNLDLVGQANPERLSSELEALAARSGLAPSNIAVEFLEAKLDDIGRFGELAAGLRERGFLVVLDDVGAGHSNLDRIPLFQPDVIKIDRSLITNVDRDYYKHFREHDDPGLLISSPGRDLISGRWTFFLARRVNGPNGEFAGIVLGLADAQYLQDFYRAISSTDETIALLIAGPCQFRRRFTEQCRW